MTSHFRSAVLSGLGIVVYVLVAVVIREHQDVPLPLALSEVTLVGVLALWPDIDRRLATAFTDHYAEVFHYRVFLGIWLAGAVVGLTASTVRRKSRRVGGGTLST